MSVLYVTGGERCSTLPGATNPCSDEGATNAGRYWQTLAVALMLRGLTNFANANSPIASSP